MADLSEPRVLETGVTSGTAVLAGPPSMWSYSSLKELDASLIAALASTLRGP